jgi:hypothetical protein
MYRYRIHEITSQEILEKSGRQKERQEEGRKEKALRAFLIAALGAPRLSQSSLVGSSIGSQIDQPTLVWFCCLSLLTISVVPWPSAIKRRSSNFVYFVSSPVVGSSRRLHPALFGLSLLASHGQIQCWYRRTRLAW